MSLKNFEEEYLFTKYKDKNVYSAIKFRGEIKDYKNVDASALYKRIINYQIKKYGTSLNGSKGTYIPIEKINARAQTRKKSRNKQRGIFKNTKIKRWTDYE